MLPPIDPTVAVANPKFDALYHDLCGSKLNGDGSSTLDVKAQKERDASRAELSRARIEAAKITLIGNALHGLAHRNSELPNELQELVAVIVAVIDGQIAKSDMGLLQDDFDRFTEHMAPIAAALSRQLQQDAATLSQILQPSDPPPPESLPGAITKLKSSVEVSHLNLAQHRRDLAHDAVQLHNLYRQLQEACIRILERTIHGSVARGTKAKADYLSLVAEGMSKKLGIQHAQILQHVYSPEMCELLREQSEELAREGRAVKRKAAAAEERLEEYRRVDGMEGLAREYAEVIRERERVKEEIGRLERGS